MAFVARIAAAQMNEYRAYIVGADGHFTASREITCAGHDEAVVWARHLVDGRDVELWSGHRFIASGPASPGSPNKRKRPQRPYGMRLTGTDAGPAGLGAERRIGASQFSRN